MKPIWKSLFVALALGAAPLLAAAPLQPAQAQAADPSVAQVQGFYDALQASMKAGGSAKSRYEKLKPAVEKAFDLQCHRRNPKRLLSNNPTFRRLFRAASVPIPKFARSLYRALGRISESKDTSNLLILVSFRFRSSLRARYQ